MSERADKRAVSCVGLLLLLLLLLLPNRANIRGQWMPLNVSCARRQTDELFNTLLLRRLARLRHQWPCLERRRAGLAPPRALARLHHAHSIYDGRIGRRQFSTTTARRIPRHCLPTLPFSLESLCRERGSIDACQFRSTFGVSFSERSRPHIACLSNHQTRHHQSVARSLVSQCKDQSSHRAPVKLRKEVQGLERAENPCVQQDEIVCLQQDEIVSLQQDETVSRPQDAAVTNLFNSASPSNRKKKRGRIPRSKALDDALSIVNGQAMRRTKWSRKADYSHQSPWSLGTRRRAGFQRIVVPESSLELSLQSVLASYMAIAARRSSRDDPSEALATIFNSDTIHYLKGKGYRETDVVLWHWILSAASSERAALRLNLAWGVAAQRTTREKAPIPVFVFLQLLRRQDLSLYALYYLIAHAWQRLGDVTPAVLFLVSRERFDSAWAQYGERALESSGAEPVSLLKKSDGKSDNMTEPSIMLMTVRLLRHARRLWPASFLSIATLFVTHVHGQAHASSSVGPSVASRLSNLYNTCLSLIAHPSSANPFNQVTHQQTAQFTILRAMDAHQPPLVVTRKGYRAVARVQLAHHKTLSEQSWADLKSASWPPWKEDKLGFDAEKGMENGLSRASYALRKMYESGYPAQVWEQTAEIYAGWDTDASPTIQTRKFIPGKLIPSHVAKDEPTDESTWAARVRATRTLDEAWSCFLQYNRVARTREQQVYLAMFEKLFFDAKRQHEEQRRLTNIQRHLAFPGDGLEVLPRPAYSNAAIYVPIPPPSIDVFLSLMKDHRIRPAPPLLASLFNHAPSFRFGRTAYEMSYKPLPLIRSFLYRRDDALIPDVAEAVKEWPEYLLAAFLQFVGKFMPPRRSRIDHGRTVMYPHRTTADGDLALAILFRVKPRYLPAWYNVISRLTSVPGTPRPGDTDVHLSNSLCVSKITHAMQEMGLEPDMDGIQLLCVALEASLWAQRTHPGQPQRQAGDERLHVDSTCDEPHVTTLRDEAETASRDVLAYIKSTFQRRVSIRGTNAIFRDDSSISSTTRFQSSGAMDPITKLPQILDMPPAPSLHALVRVLGLLRDYHGLLQLTRWIAQHGPELHLASAEKGRDHDMLKRVLVATRAFLQRAWEDEVAKATSCDSSSDEHHGFEDSLTYPRNYGTFFATNTSATSNQLHDTCAVSKSGKGAEELIQQAIDVTNSIDLHWGGWPTDDEVEDYFQRGRPV